MVGGLRHRLFFRPFVGGRVVLVVDAPRPELIAWLVLRSFGLGLTVVPILAGGMSSLPPALVNDGSALRVASRNREARRATHGGAGG